VLIAVHSFTPVYLAKSRPWQVGIVFDEDARLANALISGLTADPALIVGVNEPYAPADLVYYTVSRHARPHGLPAAMIEIRNDEIGDELGQRRWADRLADILLGLTPGLLGLNKLWCDPCKWNRIFSDLWGV
jgi:Predicted N-formylglutamate amidohydrolase